MTIVRKWIVEYLEAMPSGYRLHENDSRYVEPAKTAIGNGWDAGQCGGAVGARVALMGPRVSNPQAYAVSVLADVGSRRPAPAAPPPILPGEPESWRLLLSVNCPHDSGRRMELAPNQCGTCRREAGAPPSLAWNLVGRPNPDPVATPAQREAALGVMRAMLAGM